MPKPYSEVERSFIKARLMEEAEKCLVQYGLRKTTVDELVRRVNIPKGTFYLFYESKELLFFDVFNVLHKKMQEKLRTEIAALQDNLNVETVTEMLFRLYKDLDSTFLCSFLVSGDMELLIRRLPAEAAIAHTVEDDFSMEQFLSQLPGVRRGVDIRTFSAVLRAVFLSTLHKREIGEDVFDNALKIMLRGTVAQLFEGDVL